MSATAIIQARSGSSRLPGKVLLPLDGNPVIKHIIRRGQKADVIDEIIVATTFHRRDDLVAQYASSAGASVYRGSEDDVLGRIYQATKQANNDTIIRLTGDNPFVDPVLIDHVACKVLEEDAEYVSNKLDRTFPIGVDAEALTVDCIRRVEKIAKDPSYREHATSYIRDNPEEFVTANITQNDVYEDELLSAGTDLRLTLDEARDYMLYSKVYDNVEYHDILSVRKAVSYISENNLSNINAEVTQKTL